MKLGDIFSAGEVAGVVNNIIDRIAPDQEKAAEMKFKLAELEQNGELAKLTNETEMLKADVADRTSARTIHSNFIDFLAVVVISASAFVLYQTLFVGLSAKITDMVAGMIIGVFTSSITQILNYYFGSSSGSKAKTDAINAVIKK